MFLEMKLQEVSFDELGRQTLMVYYYGLLSHLAETMDISSKILNDEFRTTLQETFDYDTEEAITWEFSIQEALENDSYDTTTTFFQHGYDAYPLIKKHAYDAVIQDYTALVRHLQVFESNNVNIVAPDIPSVVSPTSQIDDVKNTEVDVSDYQFDQNLIDELMTNDWGSKYSTLSTDDLAIISDVMNTSAYENQELYVVNDVRPAFMAKTGGKWNKFSKEYTAKWEQPLTKAIQSSLLEIIWKHKAKKICNH